jgi:hypothetical protein
MKQRYPSYYRKKKIIITANKQQNVINKTGKKKNRSEAERGWWGAEGKGFYRLGIRERKVMNALNSK